MATGSDVVSAMALSASVLAVSADNLKAVNFGLGKSWPNWRMTERASGGTLASTTYEYSLSALTTIDRDAGIAKVQVVPTNSQPVDVSHRCSQYYDHSASAWTLQIDAAVTGKYTGYPFYVFYQYPHPRLAALTETVYAPVDTVAQVALLWMTMYGATSQNVGNEFWKAFGAEYLGPGPEQIWKRNRSEWLPHIVRKGGL